MSPLNKSMSMNSETDAQGTNASEQIPALKRQKFERKRGLPEQLIEKAKEKIVPFDDALLRVRKSFTQSMETIKHEASWHKPVSQGGILPPPQTTMRPAAPADSGDESA